MCHGQNDIADFFVSDPSLIVNTGQSVFWAIRSGETGLKKWKSRFIALVINNNQVGSKQIGRFFYFLLHFPGF